MKFNTHEDISWILIYFSGTLDFLIAKYRIWLKGLETFGDSDPSYEKY